MNLLEQAKKKYGGYVINHSQPLKDFIVDAYVNLIPASYGKQIQKKIQKDYGFDDVFQKKDVGDLLKYGKYYELKASFLSKGSSSKPSWAITNIRPWQKIDYYILCLIDSEDNFNPNFYVLHKNRIHQMRMGAQNSTNKANKDNHNVALRKSVTRDSIEFKDICRYNELNGTSENDLRDFIESFKV